MNQRNILMSSLQELADMITTGITNLESACATSNVSYPALDDSYDLQTSVTQNLCAADAAPVIAAAWQLIATLTHPNSYLFNWGVSGFYSAAIAAVGEGCVPDILREAGAQGMHVKDIAAKNSMDAGKLERNLRFLAARHIFVEVSPCVFRNNRISAALCTGKTITEMQERPLEKWDNTNGVSAMNEFVGTDGAKMAAYLVENLTDPTTACSQEPTQSAVQRAFATKLDFHQWSQLPENALRRRRFQNAMFSLTGFASTEHPRGGFEWENLPANSVVVDVGGGVGTVTKGLAENYGHLRYVIQDLPAVIAQTQEHWLSTPLTRCLLKEGTVTLQGCNFFEEQPPLPVLPGSSASVYILRFILHNWPDAYCIRILGRLRDAAANDTRLIVLDQIADYLDENKDEDRDTDEDITDKVPGAAKPRARLPLVLPYPESVAGYTYGMDMLMMGELNSQERTLGHFVTLLSAAGWKLSRVHRFPAPHPQQLVCTPI